MTAARIPRPLYALATVGALFLILPVAALLLRTNWAAILPALVSESARDALRLSLLTASAAVAVCLLLGVPLALVLARFDNAFTRLLRALITLPLVLPPLVGGIALLYLLGRTGLIGHTLDLAFGITLPFTTAAVVTAEAFVAMPFLVIAVEGALRTAGTGYEAVAATLGASRWFTFRRVTLPLIGPGLASGTVLTAARALGEFGATALFAGNMIGETRTMPLAIYTYFNGSSADQDTAIALSVLLIFVAVVFLVLLRGWRAETAK